jgi:hypothetical protein
MNSTDRPTDVLIDPRTLAAAMELLLDQLRHHEAAAAGIRTAVLDLQRAIDTGERRPRTTRRSHRRRGAPLTAVVGQES